MEKELVTSEAACAATKFEMDATLTHMRSVVVDATFHERAELMEEFKAGQHVEWELDFEIGIWKEREGELAGARSMDEKTEEPLSPMVESLKVVVPEKEAEVTTELRGK